jgi:DNA repair exonuclease SbcCD nuclease subunit
LRFAVISDPHLGAKWGTPRENDPFEQFEEAIRRSLDLGAQLILIPGDIFDTRIPKLEVWDRALRILSIPLTQRQGGVKLDRTIDKPSEEISPLAFQGTPVVALHGNHERRTRGLTNPVEALEAAGQLMHLHAGTLVFSTPDGKLAIHGLSNVPDKHLLTTLKAWNPKPIEDAFNVFVIHQSIGDFVYSTEERPPLQLSDLPPGFDIYICGHVHCRAETSVMNKPLLIPGSTERTQLLLAEAQNPKGFYIVETGDGEGHRFIELRSPRDFIYEELRFKDATIPELYGAVRAKVEELLKRHRKNLQKKPIFKIRLLGTLSKESTKSEFDEYTIIEEYKDRAIVSVRKEALVSPELEDKLHLLREFREKRLSIDEQAMALLEEYLKDAEHVRMFDVRELYGLLVEKREEEALKHILEIVKNFTKAEEDEKP